MIIPAHEILMKKMKGVCESEHSNWCTDFKLLEKSFNLIKDIKPGETAIRFGDGELVVIEGKVPNYPGRRPPHSPWLINKLFESARKTTFFGATYSATAFKRKHSHKLDKWRKRTINLLEQKNIHPKFIFDANIFTRRLDLLPHLIKDKNTLIITSKSPKLIQRLEDERFCNFFGLYPSGTSCIDIAGGTLFPHKMPPEKMYNYIFSEVEKIDKKSREKVEAVLVGAGGTAKPVVVDLVNHFPNAFIIDASSLLGGYIGKRERNPYTKDGILSHIIKWKDHI